MRLNKTTLLATLCVSGMMALPALAQDDYPSPSDDAMVVVVDQVLLGDVFANMDVTVEAGATGAEVTATATGNISSADALTGDVDYDVTQLQQALVRASAILTGGSMADGDVHLFATAYGNSAASSTTYGTAFHTLDQVSDADVSAYGEIVLDGVNALQAITTAAANLSTYTVTEGTIRGFQVQTGNADVSAYTFADICCDNSSVLINTIANGNSLTSTGHTVTNFNGAVQTMALGTNVYSETELYVQSGTTVIGSSTAAGNSATVLNEWGFATLGRDGSELFQGNGADVDAISVVTLDHWSGTSGSVAYGVGNSALISNIGSDTGLYANQENFGDIFSYASFEGGTTDGSLGYASSTAFGNAVTATLCYTCSTDGVLSGKVNQTNSGTITSYGSVLSSGNGYVQGSAIAIGNTATFQTIGTE